MSLIIRATTACPPAVKLRRFATAISILTAAATVIRMELALFLLPLTLTLVASGRLSLAKAIKSGAYGGFHGLREYCCCTSDRMAYVQSPLPRLTIICGIASYPTLLYRHSIQPGRSCGRKPLR